MFIAKNQTQWYKQFRRFLVNNSKQYYINQIKNINQFNQNDRFFNKQNHTYQNDLQKQNVCTSRIEIITKLKNSKIKASEREFDQDSNSRFNDQNRYKNKFKSKKK